MNDLVTGMYSNGATVSETWDHLDGLLYHLEIEGILVNEYLIQ